MSTDHAVRAPERLMVGHRAAIRRDGVALPVAVGPHPLLSWVTPLSRTGERQAAYEICARRRRDEPESDPIWSSGAVSSEENAWIRWGGDALRTNDEVDWRVRTSDEHGTWSGWSEIASFVVPPLTADDWTSEWISVEPSSAALTSFSLPDLGDGVQVRSALLHIAAQGLVRVIVDGTCVNQGARDPSDTALARAVSRSYDVMASLDPTRDRHVIALIGARGHLHRVINRVRLIAELQVVSADGSVTSIGTDAHWQERRTSLIEESPFYAEVHDARRGEPWETESTSALENDPTSPGHGTVRARSSFDDGETAALPIIVQPDAGPPVRAVRSIAGIPIHHWPDTAVFDLGENVAARSTITVSGCRSGQRLVVVHGEMLRDSRVDTSNLSLPDDRERERQVVEWICGDSGSEVIEPWFAIHGFRYLEIRGLDGAVVDEVIAYVTHSDIDSTGSFTCTDTAVTRLVEMAARTQLNNTHAHPEDCPTREQAGWTGDASVSAEAALNHLDIAGVYRNWLTDVALDQREDGGILGVSPFLLREDQMQPADPVWGSALTEISWQYWWATGESDLLHDLLPAMRRWADWQYRASIDGLVLRADISYGADWLALEQTPPVLLQTAAAERSLRVVAEFEAKFGEPGRAVELLNQADELRASARRNLWDPDEGIWGNGSQSSFGVALATGWVDPEERELVDSRLRALVGLAGNRLASGYAGTQSVVRSLGGIDGGRTLLACLRQTAEPGIGAMLTTGPGTFWETWWIEEPTLGIASLDHIGLAAPFAAWAWRDVAGLRALEPGYRSFAVDPRLVELVSSATVTRMTPRGLIELHWERRGDAVDIDVAVPIGAVAELTDGRQLSSGRHLVSVPLPATVASRADAPFERRPRTRLWLGGGHDDGEWITDATTTIQTVTEPWVCSPVFHEPLPAPIREVVIDGMRRGDECTVRLELPTPIRVSDERFVFALVDLDSGQLPGERIVPLLRLVGRAGTMRFGRTRWLPVAWNRVAVDLDDWPLGEDIVSVEVGVHWSSGHDIARGTARAAADSIDGFLMRIGEVGVSSAKRTW